MGATVNTLTIDSGDQYAVDNVRLELSGTPRSKALKLTPKQREYAAYVKGTSFTKVKDHVSGRIVGTRRWKATHTNVIPTKVSESRVMFVLYQHNPLVRKSESNGIIRLSATLDEATGLWTIVHEVRGPGSGMNYVFNKLVGFAELTAEELVDSLQPYVLCYSLNAMRVYGDYLNGAAVPSKQFDQLYADAIYDRFDV